MKSKQPFNITGLYVGSKVDLANLAAANPGAIKTSALKRFSNAGKRATMAAPQLSPA
jgi:hypothetical protein